MVIGNTNIIYHRDDSHLEARSQTGRFADFAQLVTFLMFVVYFGAARAAVFSFAKCPITAQNKEKVTRTISKWQKAHDTMHEMTLHCQN